MPKVMLITGSRKGIGKYLTEYYVKQGFLVEGCSRKPPEWKMERYHHHSIDISDETQVKQMFTAIRKRHGRLDVTLNNAGIASMNHVLLTPAATVSNLMATNFLGTFLVCRESAKLMVKRKYGRIVNFTTIAVPMQLEGEAIYAATKSAVETFTKILAREFADMGITCNAIGPTPIPTDLIKAVPQEKIEALINRLGIKRAGRFEDVSNVLDFFIKTESEYISGQIIYLGGIT